MNQYQNGYISLSRFIITFFEVVMDDPLSFPRLSALDYQAMVVQRLDNAIHEMSCYPVDKC